MVYKRSSYLLSLTYLNGIQHLILNPKLECLKFSWFNIQNVFEYEIVGYKKQY